MEASHRMIHGLFRSLALSLVAVAAASAQNAPRPAPERGAQGDGPFERLVLRGATMIDGTGAPPRGPVDIVIEGNRLAEIRNLASPGVPIDSAKRPGSATREIEAEGMYVLPGFVDVHTHTGGMPKAPEAEYVYKLWMAHGVTTTRDAGSGASDFILGEKRRSARNEIVAPRIFAYARAGTGEGWNGGPVQTPEKAREWVRWAKAKGIDGLKLGAHDPDIMAALIDEARQHGLGTMAHLGQDGVGRMNVLDAARLGLGTQTHFYGLFEALLDDYTVQDWPPEQNYNDEEHRFAQVGRLWNQIHPRGSDRWRALVDELIGLHLTIDPTFTIYEANRNLMAARRAEWHDRYTLPSLWEFYEPSRANHGSYWYDWTTHDEASWQHFYRVWMDFVNDFKNAGGRVTTGSDSGFLYELYGFAYVRELELLQEAGFHPLEVVRSATLNGAETLFEPKGVPIELGLLRPGLLADLVVVGENPLQNFKVLYGGGTPRLNADTGRVERVGGVRYTIKDGIVYNARELLNDVARMVERAKSESSRATTP